MELLKEIVEKDYEKTIKSLEEFAQQTNEDMALEQSEDNIKNGSLSIIKKGKHLIDI